MWPWWLVLRQILVFSASLAVCLAGYGLAAVMIRHDPRLIGLLPLPAAAGFLGGLAVWLFGEPEADIGPLMVPPYALCLFLLGVVIVVGGVYVPDNPALAGPARTIGWSAVVGMGTLTGVRVVRDLHRWFRTGGRVPLDSGQQVGRSGAGPPGEFEWEVSESYPEPVSDDGDRGG